MKKDELIEEIIRIGKKLKPTLVRRKEQLKGILWLIEVSNVYNYDGILEKIKEKYEVK